MDNLKPSSYFEKTHFNLGEVEDKSIEEIFCIVDACYSLQESISYGIDLNTNVYKLSAYSLVYDYLTAKDCGSFVIHLAQMISHSVNEFEYMFHELVLIRKHKSLIDNPVFKLMEKEEFKTLLEDYRKEKVNPLILDVIKTLKLEKIREN